MKFPPTSEIRKRRKLLDITQTELATASGVSQSTITKVESGKISASYDTVVKLFETLEIMGEQKKNAIPIMDIATKDVVSIQETEPVSRAIELLKITGFSQIPVFSGDIPVGSISERSFFKFIRSGKTMEQLSRMMISEVMDEPFPSISENISMDALSTILATSNAALINRKGKIVGLVTSADVLKLV